MTLFSNLSYATLQTLYMVLISLFFSTLIGLPLAMIGFNCEQLSKNHTAAIIISGLINIIRSIPFIILLVAIIPFTRLIVGSSIGIHAAMVPLIIGAIPFYARLAHNAFQGLSPSLIEAGRAMGMTNLQIIRFILLPEARAELIKSMTITAIALVNYSAMAGTVGGGGLGDLAIRYGYQRFEPIVMILTVIILIVLVQSLQSLGDKLVKKLEH